MSEDEIKIAEVMLKLKGIRLKKGCALNLDLQREVPRHGWVKKPPPWGEHSKKVVALFFEAGYVFEVCENHIDIYTDFEPEAGCDQWHPLTLEGIENL